MVYELLVPQYIRVLKNLNSMMGKAAGYADSKKFEIDVLAQSRLAPDQFPFYRQVQIVCDTAKLSASRLTGKDAPVHDDKETSWTQLKKRVEDVIGYLESFKAKDFEGAETRKITQPRWEGKWLTGYEYTIHHAIPNFYFHVTTAYSILRHNGVDVGKKDYLGELPYKN